jgi:endonuclease/exonuclease/phosphatase family metal-dependent hydrolase
MHVRVVTINVQAPEFADWPQRCRVLADGLRSLRPDIVALQEVVRNDNHDAVHDLLGPGWYAAWNSRRTPDGLGTALASRWPIDDVRELDEHVSERAARFSAWCTSLVATVKAPQPIGPLLMVHHKPSWPYDLEYERELQAVATARLAETALNNREMHTVLLGDMDAVPDAASIRFLTGRQSLQGMSVCYRDAWATVHPGEPGHTFSSRNRLVREGDMPFDPGRRIDYIMVRCAHHGPTLDVADCQRIFTDEVDGVQASDHYGVVADLTMPSRPPGSFGFRRSRAHDL